MTVLYVLIAILIFGVLIAVHEFGHFIVAKLCGVRVEEFAMGMGPVIFQRQKGETMYSLRAFPIGGFCAMTGEDEDSDDPRAFGNQNALKRVLILTAGAFNNFVIGFLVVVLLYSGAAAFRVPVIKEFMDGCPYQGEDALMTGDRFIKIDGHRIYEQSDVSEFLAKNTSGIYDIVVSRDGKHVKLENFHFVPVEYEGYEKKMYGFYFDYEPATLKTVITNSWGTTMEFSRLVWMGLQQLVSGQVGVQDLSGPVGIVDLMAETGEKSASFMDAVENILYLGAFIAVNLAIMNLLPIPALDGGRIFTLIVTAVIELIIRKKLNPKFEGYIHAGGMVLLLALMAFVMFNDIIRIVTG